MVRFDRLSFQNIRVFYYLHGDDIDEEHVRDEFFELIVSHRLHSRRYCISIYLTEEEPFELVFRCI
jgi:hypothetical protein